MSPGITLQQAQAHLDTWLAADTAVSSGQVVEINGRHLTKVNAREIRENINYWENKVNRFSRGGVGIRRVRLAAD